MTRVDLNERAIFGSLSFSSEATYTYDSDANQITIQEGARSVTYHYDDLGRMSSAVVQSLGQTTVETYHYNGNGIRVSKKPTA